MPGNTFVAGQHLVRQIEVSPVLEFGEFLHRTRKFKEGARQC